MSYNVLTIPPFDKQLKRLVKKYPSLKHEFAGKFRDYNITKNEWVLNGETVLYASAVSLRATVEYDFEQEKKFRYKGLNEQEIIR